MKADKASQAWVDEFKKLPSKRRDSIKKWYAVQAFYAKELGLDLEKWMVHIQWAFAHPFDYSFIADFPELMAALGEGDGFEKAQSSSALLGQSETIVPQSGDQQSGNSLFDLMLGRTSESTSQEDS